mgnify:CR=1 FL=1
MKSYIEVLSRSMLFSGVSQKELICMLKCLGVTYRKFEKGEYILNVGDKIDSVGIVVSGSAEINKEDVFGRKTIMAHLEETDYFGEVMVCAGINKSISSVLALTDVVICYLEYSHILNRCGNSCEFHTRLISNMLGILANKSIHLSKKIDHLLLKGMREKIIAYLLDCYKKDGNLNLTIPFNREGLAEFLSVDRSALSRELGRMRDEGLISFKGRNITILDLDRMENPF